MSQENVEVVRQVYAAFARGDFASAAEVYDPYVVFVHRLESEDQTVWGWDIAGPYWGIDGLRDYMRALLEPWAKVTIEADELIEAGDSVFAAVLMHVLGREGGVPAELRFFHVWTFRAGKVIRLEVAPERRQALEAVGLSE